MQTYFPADCGIPMDIPNAVWAPGPSLEGSMTTYTCSSNTVLEGNPAVVCGNDGMWSKPEFYCRRKFLQAFYIWLISVCGRLAACLQQTCRKPHLHGKSLPHACGVYAAILLQSISLLERVYYLNSNIQRFSSMYAAILLQC